MLEVGDIVRGPLWPEAVEVKKCEDMQGSFYRVEAYGRDSNTYYQVIVLPQQLESIEKLNGASHTIIDATEMQRYMLYRELLIDRKYSKARALGSQNVMPLPHQIEAVYGRMLQVPSVRFLLADDPGAGKTIMAGMLIRELKARRSADRILILVPPLVLKQWQQELNEKFGEDFTIITRHTLKEYNGKNPFIEQSCVLTSLYWASRDDVKALLMEADFDLVIVDEAHKMAAYTTGTKNKKTKRTKIYQLGERILRHSEHALLLTATPHKGDVENFRHLMRLIDEDIFSSIGIKETLRDKSNPFIIRRLKENLKYFDGSPLFPKRTTKTIKYTLSDKELELYETVTEYVKQHFNRAMNRGHNSTAFAMMLLQRRLSSSIEAIHLSLVRRHERLVRLLEELHNQESPQFIDLDVDEYEDSTLEEQEILEQSSEHSFDAVDPNELEVEIAELMRLIEYSGYIRQNYVERKYVELENTLFGENGLLRKGEKILIFTESTDTLHYLEQRLSAHGLGIAKIVGKYSMDERRRQVELFRNEYPIMLATDAGGESINLQFCNQMVNYDIPWNPNKLEQRMGRIHRIGQKNEVFVCNLVAGNTREGDVLHTLLVKMEKMRHDLGHDLVYDFVGDRLEERMTDLPTLMQHAVLHRERLEDIKRDIEQVISEEYQELLRMAQEESLAMDTLDVSGMKREQYDIAVQRVPGRVYAEFTAHTLSEHRVRVYPSHEEQVYRIERLPKSLREFARKHHITLKGKEDSYRFTGHQGYGSDEIEIVGNDYSLFLLSLQAMKEESEGTILPAYEIPYAVSERLEVEGYEISLTDGTCRELHKDIVYLAKRENGEVVELDSYWLYSAVMENAVSAQLDKDVLLINAMQHVMKKREEFVLLNENQLSKKLQFLRRAFDTQYETTANKLEKYRNEDLDNRNSALINQTKAQLIDIEERRKRRLDELERERNVNIVPPRRIASLVLMPAYTNTKRLLASDYEAIITAYEEEHQRKHVKMYPNLALVDFMSEDENGKPRGIIVANPENLALQTKHERDLEELGMDVYMYVVEDGVIVREYLL
ncbi:DEAD/DEAH box helicase [Ectobacillus sp. JY-23]|uniref:DEAD/DEAH box helicase n=1 Tax=Ectobacillus sp. JY-23 TaxID=2933872 RepID=UPI001FF5A77F|nr:helicase-related protein [Ectobacillus sp. JY-23]UOY92507.1 DEAD/DEAH box helicase [Ectobacillus sp. JY-23]